MAAGYRTEILELNLRLFFKLMIDEANIARCMVHIFGHCWPNNTQNPTPFHLGNPSRYMLTKMLSYYTLEKKNLCGLMIDALYSCQHHLDNPSRYMLSQTISYIHM